MVDLGFRARVTELRQTLRALGRARWYSVTIVIVLGLAMALATTVFAIVDGVLFRPLPYPDSAQLYKVVAGFKGIDPAKFPSSVGIADLRNWVAAAPDVQFTGFSARTWKDLGGGLNDENLAGMARVQANIFDVLRVPPLFGGFQPDDFVQQTAIRPVIATYDVWQRRFRGDPAIIGKTFSADPAGVFGYRVVGVMPRGFSFPTERAEVSFITPMVEATDAPGDVRNFYDEVIARAPRAVGAAAVRARVEAGMAVTAASFPARGPKPTGTSDRTWRMQGPVDQATVALLTSTVGQQSRPLFSAVFLAVIVIVALGSLNVSGLMASRVLDRARELNLRRALGASSGSIARLIALEALLLTGAGGAVGLLCTPPLLRLALSLLPEETVLLKPAQIDWRVALFVMLGVIALAAPTAVWPVRRALRRGAGPASDAGRSSPRVRSAGRFMVVAVQVAAAFVLTVTGSLLVSSVLSVYSNEQPIRSDGVVVLEGTSFARDPVVNRRSPQRALRIAALIDRLRQLPGVAGASVTSAQVLKGGNWPSWFTPPEGAIRKALMPDIQGVMPGYFSVLKPQLVAGRLPSDEELRQNAHVIAVSESLARAYWPEHSPIGLPLVASNDPQPYIVVGMVKDVRWWAWDEEVASIYAPFEPMSRYPTFSVVIHAPGNTGRVMTRALDMLRSADPLVTYSRAATLDHMFADSIRPRRFQSWLFGSFASAALAVVGVGILGLLAMSAARRTKEVGIRQTLGATKAEIVRLFLREQLAPVAVGLAAGGCVAAWTTQFVKASLYGVTSSDIRVWAVAAALIVGIAALGTLIPAVRASRVDPSQVLRAE